MINLGVCNLIRKHLLCRRSLSGSVWLLGCFMLGMFKRSKYVEWVKWLTPSFPLGQCVASHTVKGYAYTNIIVM